LVIELLMQVVPENCYVVVIWVSHPPRAMD